MNIQTFSSIEEALNLLTGAGIRLYYPDKWGTGWESTRFSIPFNILWVDYNIRKEHSMILHNNSIKSQEVMWYDDKKYHVVLWYDTIITYYYKDVMEFYNNGLGLREYIEARLL